MPEKAQSGDQAPGPPSPDQLHAIRDLTHELNMPRDPWRYTDEHGLGHTATVRNYQGDPNRSDGKVAFVNHVVDHAPETRRLYHLERDPETAPATTDSADQPLRLRVEPFDTSSFFGYDPHSLWAIAEQAEGGTVYGAVQDAAIGGELGVDRANADEAQTLIDILTAIKNNGTLDDDLS